MCNAFWLFSYDLVFFSFPLCQLCSLSTNTFPHFCLLLFYGPPCLTRANCVLMGLEVSIGTQQAHQCIHTKDIESFSQNLSFPTSPACPSPWCTADSLQSQACVGRSVTGNHSCFPSLTTMVVYCQDGSICSPSFSLWALPFLLPHLRAVPSVLGEGKIVLFKSKYSTVTFCQH